MAFKKLIAIGEALIDFIPQQVGVGLKQVEGFIPKVGGAPANVCGAFSKLGGDSMLLTKLGEDAFGDKIVDELMAHNINVEHVLRTKEANTALAFVSLEENGNREFSFYRKPSADMLLEPDELKKEWFKEIYALHFCSVDLIPCPMKEAHKKAIELASNEGGIISFDPNVRFPLWESKEALRNTILEFIPKADIIKISDEELEFITGYKTVEEVREVLFSGNVKLVLFTKGSEGAEAYTSSSKTSISGCKVKAVDTTGAGDGFIGAFLYQLMKDQVTKEELDKLGEATLSEYLTFANHFCAYSVQQQGAIASYPDFNKVKAFINK